MSLTRLLRTVLLSVLFSGFLLADEEVPLPPLEGLEEAVRERLTTAREALLAAVGTEDVEPSELADLFGNTAMVFHAHHSFEVAEACYLRAIELAPEDLRWPYILGYLYQDTGRFAEAATSYGSILEVAPEDPLANLRLGEVRLSLNQLELAESYLDVAREVPGLEAAALAGLGKIEMGKGELETAVGLYAAALDMQPSATQLYYPMALALRRLGRTDEAREAISKGGQSKVEARDDRLAEVGSLTVSSEMFMTSGARAIKAGNLEQAALSFRGAIAARPDNARAHLNLAVVRRQMGDLEEAAESARAALSFQPDYFFAHFNLGEILEEQGDTSAAEAEYRSALEINPEHILANQRMAALRMRQGNFAAAVEHYQRVIEGAPSQTAARYLMALAWVAQGEITTARKVVDSALEVSPEEPKLQEAFVRLAAIDPAASDEERTRALELALETQRSTPTFSGAETLALALAAAGRTQEAASIQQQLIDQLPPSADSAVVAWMQDNLDHFAKGQAAVEAWP